MGRELTMTPSVGETAQIDLGGSTLSRNMNAKSKLVEGMTDAAGFVIGSLIAFGLGRLLGFDLFAPGYGFSSTVAILLAGLGAGLGVAAARRLVARML